MTYSVRDVGALVVGVAVFVAPALARAEAPASSEAAPAAAGDEKKAEEKKPEKKGEVGGYAYDEKRSPRREAPHRVWHRATLSKMAGPTATYPGIEVLSDGGSRWSVRLNQSAIVEERRAAGAITYVLKGTHLRVHNDGNALVSLHLNTPVARARLAQVGADVHFVLELRPHDAATTASFKVEENPDKSALLRIDFPKGDYVHDLPPEPKAVKAPESDDAEPASGPAP
jgi:hypothetical protein